MSTVKHHVSVKNLVQFFMVAEHRFGSMINNKAIKKVTKKCLKHCNELWIEFERERENGENETCRPFNVERAIIVCAMDFGWIMHPYQSGLASLIWPFIEYDSA